MAKRTIVGIGEVLWDIFGRAKHLGGATANFAFHASELGDRGALVSRIGRDRLGNELAELMKTLDLSTEFLQVDGRRSTGTVVVKVDGAGQPTFDIVRNVAYDNLRATKKLMALAQRADAVCYGTLGQRSAVSRSTIRKFLAAAKKAVLVCDLNLRSELLQLGPGDAERLDLVAQSIAMADVLKLNDDEVRIIRGAFARPEKGDAFLRWLLREFKLRMVCVTLGSRGCVLRTARRRVTSPGVKVKVADTVGSGDAFTAAMVNRLLRRRPLQATADFANRIGAYVASRPGATPRLDGFR